MTEYKVPLIIRGRVIDDCDVQHGGRRGGISFATPDVRKYISELGLAVPSKMADLYECSLDDILDYLEELGQQLHFSHNVHMQQAFEVSCRTSGFTEDMLRYTYSNLAASFNRELIRDLVDRTIGIPYVNGWVSHELRPGVFEAMRPFGARAVHVIAGNSPIVSAMTIIRNAVVRGDAIIKTPSNDPLTAAAIVRTMVDFAPNHPLTRHVSVAYWKGGDEEVEQAIYQPRNIEKLVAWGGFASVKHITKYIQPGIDLLTLDPKLSSSIIGEEAFASEATMSEVALRLANDIGVNNQEACANARVIYIQTGTDEAGLANANRFGDLLYEAIQSLPVQVSGVRGELDSELSDEIESLKLTSDEHQVFGGDRRGAVIVSQESEPVDFSRILGNRVANLVPIDSMDVPIKAVTAYTQTIGVYPDSLKPIIRDQLAFHGAQRIVSLGYAVGTAGVPTVQDSVEPIRRLCKWILDEYASPEAWPLPSQRAAQRAMAETDA